MKAKEKVAKQLVCLPKRLTAAQLLEAARHAIEINPINRPPVERMAALGKGFAPTPQRIAVLTTAYWGSAGVKLTVGFLETAVPALKTRILSHMNAWNKNALMTSAMISACRRSTTNTVTAAAVRNPNAISGFDSAPAPPKSASIRSSPPM